MEKLRVGLLFGGRSVEHDVSILSASSILSALDRSRYEVSLVGVDPEGGWHLSDADTPLPEVLDAPRVVLPATPGPTRLQLERDRGEAAPLGELARVDVIFPIIHGRGGEDGALQGLLELADVPYVGSGVLGSALQMDKDLAKRLLSAAGLPVTPWVSFSSAELRRDGLQSAAERAEAEIGLPVFVKPANSGSSVGISRADSLSELVAALAEALRFDRKVLVETAVDAREIEVAVLGNAEPEASIPGEIRAAQAFYDYDSKYRDGSTELIIPAELDAEKAEALRTTAIAAFRALEGEGMARVDFLVEHATGDFMINELNSLPGFTEVSMYPKLWAATGLPYPRLLDRLIELALERHSERSKLETHTPPPLDGGTKA
ncbi:MAG: D-alanine--D-alanine ligase [Deltaproteobacteria bacterium]|jgi:D-alanine-D-alanine ligase|nr:D-alanine--D-alanine ligase [Deltaproteobacteria bacterium]